MSFSTSGDVAANRDDWNASLEALDGHLLQSWQWGSFRERYGWHAERIVWPDFGTPRAMAQVLFRSRGPVSIGYIPRGPAFAPGDIEAVSELLKLVDEAAKRHRALYLMIEANSALPFSGTFRDHGFVKGVASIQPERTVQIPLLDDDALLKQMHEKTRYSVRLAGRRGVEIEIPTDIDAGVRAFYALLDDTAGRNEFAIRSFDYYIDFMAEFGDHARLMLAHHEGNLAAGVIAARFGNEAMYMYGASSTVHRGHGATFLLQFEAMKWGRDEGSRTYDLWGIPAQDPEKTGGDGKAEGTKGEDWSGLYRFKTGFGGEIVRFPVPIERRYHPFLTAGVRRVLGHHE